MVTLLTTDAWAKAKEEVGALWRRFRPEHAEVVEAELVEARHQAVAGGEAALGALTAEWESRLARLLAADAAAAGDLARVAGTLATMLAGQDKKVTITQHVNASGHASVIQVAGDAEIGTARRDARPGTRENANGP
jgi:hypothetical protein